MGAKNTSKVKYKGTAYKCDLCGRKFMSLDALKSHQRTLHNLRPDKTRVRQYAKQAKKTEAKEKLLKKKPSVETPPIASRATRTKAVKSVSATNKVSPKVSTVEFECPKCFKCFQKYYYALKHIQNLHPVDTKGVKVPPNSPRMIQPERKELCLKCERKVKSIPTHVCGVAIKTTTDEEGFDYTCTACDLTFNSKKEFYTHVMVSHPEGVEGLFFPTNIEFSKWKTEMETQTRSHYTESDKFDSKCYFHCAFKSGNFAKSTVNLCPSIIVVQEFLKGLQVHFYKCHHKHSTSEYKLLNKYKKYSITAFLKSSEAYYDLTDIKCDEDDMYMQFKTLMESIVLDAAKLNKDSLKILLGKALEMTQILTSYDEEAMDDGSRPLKSTLTDIEISKALEQTMSKRKTIDKDNDEPIIKRPKSMDEDEISSPKILNSFSLADNPLNEETKIPDTNQTTSPKEKQSIKVRDIASMQIKKDIEGGAEIILQTKNIETPVILEESETSETPKILEPTAKDFETNYSHSLQNLDKLDDSSQVELIPSSFNESYADFLEKNFVTPGTEVGSKRRQPNRNIVKTKIGQFKPSSPKKVYFNKSNQESKLKSIVKAKVNTVEKPKEIDNTKLAENTKILEKLKKNSLEKTKKVPIEKPKKIAIDKPTVDFKYEVKERGDDCNILILKI